MKNIGTKSVDMSDIMVYLAMFSTIIVCTHKMKIGLWYPLELGTFLISEDPPPNFGLFPTETWDFFDFCTIPPPPIWTVSQISPLFSLESFPYALKGIFGHIC